MGTKTSKEKDIDSDRPSTIRIIAGILVLSVSYTHLTLPTKA